MPEIAAPAAAPPLSVLELWRLLIPFRARALVVTLLVLVDTMLASLGVGIVFPVLQAVLDAEHRSTIVTRWLPSFDRLSSDMRLLALGLSTIAVFAAKGAIGMITVRSSQRLLHRLRFYWVQQIGVAYLCGPFGRTSLRKQGELLNEWFNETLAATRFFQAYLAYASSLVLVIALGILGFVVNWRAMLALSALSALISLAVRRTLYTQSIVLSSRKVQVNQALSSIMVEDLANLRDIKLLTAENARLQLLKDSSGRLGRALMQSAVIAEVPRVISETLAVTLLMGMVLVGALVLRLDQALMFPMIVFFSVAAYRLVSAASQMAGARIRALNEVQSLRKVREAVARANDREVLDRGLPLQRVTTDIVLRNLSFAYEAGTPVLDGVNAVIPQGKLTLLIGPSGAGKSTLLDVLLRLIEPLRGTIEANGRTAAEFRLGDWRRAFGYVSQDVSLFNGTIRANLLLARPEATGDDVIEACRLAGADQFIDALPGGYESIVGDRGHRLSGGQRKRIAIARALIARPSVLILDEATTSFEQSLEESILRNIKAAIPELTVIQVTHRFDSTRRADWIIGLENGCVTASGSWEDMRTIPSLQA